MVRPTSSRDELSAVLQQYLSQIKKAESHSISEGELGRDMSTQIEREVTTLVKLRHRMTELVRQLRSRVIYAPSSGTIVASNRIPEPTRDEINKTKLNRWHGTPLDPRNSGCFVDAGEELMSIAPTDELHAVMYIDQSDREDFVDDMEVELKLDELPNISYVAPMTLMSRRGEKVAPESLTTKYGGTLGTRPDDKGQETLTSTAFRATVEMHFIHENSKDDAALIKPGMRGKARILIDDRTAWQWLVRYLFETFRFRL